MTDQHNLSLEELKQALKVLIINECDKDVSASDMLDHEQLIGGALELDSLDALQICMAVKKQYGVRIQGGPAARKALVSVDSLASTIYEARP